VPVSEIVATLAGGVKVKRRFARMRACNEKDAKGKLCAGHLKRWYFFGDEVKRQLGASAEVYRCERCQTLYLPPLDEVIVGEPERDHVLHEVEAAVGLTESADERQPADESAE